MSTPKHNLILLTPPEPPPELIQEALDKWINSGLHDFASNLETARTMWRKWPEVVEAPKFPEQFRAAYVEETGREPDDDCGIAGEEVFETGWPENLRPDAIRTARVWMDRERAEEDVADTKFLGEMGVTGESQHPA
jgi:hypothetical protein